MRLHIAGLAFGIAFIPQASAFYQFFSLIVNGTVTQGYKYVRLDGRYGAPVYNVSSIDMRCNYPYAGYGTSVWNPVADVEAGSVVGFQLSSPINEHGVLNVYLSRAPNKVADYDGSGGWFKIYEVTAKTVNGAWSFPTDNARNITFPLPKSIPSAEYLLRIEHISLQLANKPYGARFYLACGQIAITGGGTANPATVLIPGVYRQDDPGILIDINKPAPAVYPQPGPKVFKG